MDVPLPYEQTNGVIKWQMSSISHNSTVDLLAYVVGFSEPSCGPITLVGLGPGQVPGMCCGCLVWGCVSLPVDSWVSLGCLQPSADGDQSILERGPTASHQVTLSLLGDRGG